MNIIVSRLFFVVLFLTAYLLLQAEVVTLSSGRRIVGDIITINNDIVIIKTADGKRFQFPKNEVTSISEETNVEKQPMVVEKINIRKVAVRLSADGGIVFIPNNGSGGNIGVDIAIGTSNLLNKRIFTGGSIGYESALNVSINENKTSTHFIPVQAVFSIPLLNGVNSPEVGASIGYGFGFGKNIKSQDLSGITSSVILSYRHQLNTDSVFLLGLIVRFQQSTIRRNEIINTESYTGDDGCCFISTSLRATLQF